MEKSFFYWLDEHQSESFEKVDELSEILSHIGVSIEIKNSNAGNYIEFNYDMEKINKKLKRHAGRKKARCAMSIETKDVRERMDKGESAERIASELGISRSTLFRKLKYAEEHDIMFL